MEAFKRLDVVAVPIDTDNVDTDAIFPARLMRKPRVGNSYGEYLLHDQRFNEDGSKKSDYVLNQPPYQGARILVAARNYGCGSSRLGAIFVHVDYGFRAIVAAGFGNVFFNNCLKQGILPIRLDFEATQKIREQLHANPGIHMVVDLETQTVTGPDGTRHEFTIDSLAKKCLLAGLSDIGLTLTYEKDIASFEKKRAALVDWVGITAK